MNRPNRPAVEKCRVTFRGDHFRKMNSVSTTSSPASFPGCWNGIFGLIRTGLSLSLFARNSYLDTKRWSEFERWKSDFENSTFAEILADPRVPQGRFNAGIRATRFSRKEHAVRSLSRAANNKNHAPFSRCLFFPRLDFDRPSPQTIQRETAFESSFKLSSSLRRNIVVRSN